MRLIKINDSGLLELSPRRPVEQLPPYAILSHTWDPDEEVVYEDLLRWRSPHKTGWEKILFCQSQALRDGFRNFWCDSCCIKKADSAEKHDAFNSMFSWYANSSVCYVFLSDVYSIKDLPSARWWKRGWTLQELLAPHKVLFFTAFGDCLGDKSSLEQEIHQITGIQLTALRGYPLSMFSFNERWVWMKSRETRFEEDYAYCMQGIFGVGIERRYGESLRQAVNRLRDAERQSRIDIQLKLEEAVYGTYAAAEPTCQTEWPQAATNPSMTETSKPSQQQAPSSTGGSTGSSEQSGQRNGSDYESDPSISRTSSSLESESEGFFDHEDDSSCTSASVGSDIGEDTDKDSEAADESDGDSAGSWRMPRHEKRRDSYHDYRNDETWQYGGYPRRVDIVEWVNREVHRFKT